ncbi:MAG: histidine kinase [Pseudomonadota bacterium]
MPRALYRPLSLFKALDPRRSLATSIGWLVVVLSLGLAALAGFWEGELARDSLLEQRAERAANAAEQWSSGLDAALAQRRQPLRTAAAMVPKAVLVADAPRLAAVFRDLQAGYPELVWIGLATADGRMLASTPAPSAGESVVDQTWFRQGLLRPWIGQVDPPAQAAPPAAAPDGHPPPGRWLVLAVPVQDASGHAIGVIGAHLEWAWVLGAAEKLRQRVPLLAGGDALLLDAADRVLIGPAGVQGRSASPGLSHVFASVRPSESGGLHALGWRVLLQWSGADATRQADAARRRIVGLALGLGALAALIGIGLVGRLTRRLSGLTAAVQVAHPRAGHGVAVPRGHDEVSQLGHAFNALLLSLQQERDALARLSGELELRVQARTREVERLAEEARYAAVVRERLRIARDMHDTLAHSMMAMLTEVRMLRKLHVHDPQALPAELERAEQAAREGLSEARAAIMQMRFNGVRDIGLGPALADALTQFTHRSGLPVAYSADPQAARFADARAETVFRIAEEALRNIERHAAAAHVTVGLQDGPGGCLVLTVADDGVGFDPQVARHGQYGLVGLREQAHLVGAELTITSVAGQGSRLQLSLRTEPDLHS